MDHFQRLGLARRYAIDSNELERSYLDRSRDVHPDFHLAGSEAELSASLESSAALNEAYSALRDPFARADYLLSLYHGPTANEYRQMPPDFLAEMLEAREEVEQARGKPEAVASLDASISLRAAAIQNELLELFERVESLPFSAPERSSVLARIRGVLNAAKYIRGLLRDLHAD